MKKSGLDEDVSQLQLVRKLSKYINEFHRLGSANLLTKAIKIFYTNPRHHHHGIYIWGDVGRGKSMILDLFFDAVPFEQKLKIHFHKFMMDFHKDLNKLRDGQIGKSGDYIRELGKELSKKYKVICLDELQINNIVDAMVVGRLFEELITSGSYVFFTSNRPPQDLFIDGLQRERFLPFIDLIKEKLDIFELNNFEDYRLRALSEIKTNYLYPINKKNNAELNEMIDLLTGHAENLDEVQINSDNNRTIYVHKAYGKVAVFTFNELCEVSLGALDYLAICKRFNTLIIKNIPKMDKDNHNEALRFITLIDCLYENNIAIICTAETEPDKLYKDGKNSFEFKRTISRLNEMRSANYLKEAL